MKISSTTIKQAVLLALIFLIINQVQATYPSSGTCTGDTCDTSGMVPYNDSKVESFGQFDSATTTATSQPEYTKIKNNLQQNSCKLLELINSTKTTEQISMPLTNNELTLKKVCQGFVQKTFLAALGLTSSGKSTFLAWLMGISKLLPQSSAAATSIPTRIYHGLTLMFVLPQCDKWNAAIDTYMNRLLVHSLNIEIVKGQGESHLYELQEEIREGNINIRCNVTNNRDAMAEQLWRISHFIRLVWKNELDLEKDFNISLEYDQLPRIDVPMKTFSKLGSGNMAFLDTAGINEAKTKEILEKLTPKFIHHAAGIILCIGTDQVDHKEVDDLFSFVNKHMRGKTIIIVLIMRGGKEDNEMEQLKNKLLNELLPSMRKKAIIMTSLTRHMQGMFKLREYLKSSSALQERPWWDFRQRSHSIDIGFMQQQSWWKDLEYGYPTKVSVDPTYIFSWPNLIKRGRQDEAIDDMIQICRREIKVMKGDEMQNIFRGLYKKAELLAHQGNFALIQNNYDQWKSNLEQLVTFAEASSTEREKIQKELEEQKKMIGAIILELDRKPIELQSALQKFFDLFQKQMFEHASQQDGWHVVYENHDGSVTKSDEIIFYGGKAEFRIWCRETAKAKLDKNLSDESKNQLNILQKAIQDYVPKYWDEMTTIIKKLPKFMNTNDVPEINLQLVPKLEINVRKEMEKFEDMDPSTIIPFRERGDEIVVDNYLVSPAILKEFKATVNRVINQNQISFQHEVNDFLKPIERRIKFEKEKANLLYEQNVAFLKAKADEYDIQQLVLKATAEGKLFEKELRVTRNELDDMEKKSE